MAVDLVILIIQTPVKNLGLINLDVSGKICSLVADYFNNCLNTYLCFIYAIIVLEVCIKSSTYF